MNTAKNDAHQSDAFVERALANMEHVMQVAQSLTEALGLPKEACYVVLSGMIPTLLEEFCTSEPLPEGHDSSIQHSPTTNDC